MRKFQATLAACSGITLQMPLMVCFPVILWTQWLSYLYAPEAEKILHVSQLLKCYWFSLFYSFSTPTC